MAGFTSEQWHPLKANIKIYDHMLSLGNKEDRLIQKVDLSGNDAIP
jgi:hypothetical protein